MVARRGMRVVVAPELLVAGDLIHVEQSTRFEMRRQMYGAQAALQLGNRGRHDDEPVRGDTFLCCEMSGSAISLHSRRADNPLIWEISGKK